MVDWLEIPYENLSNVATIDIHIQTVWKLKEAVEKITELERIIDFMRSENDKK